MKLNPVDVLSRRPDYIFGKDNSIIILPTLYKKLRLVDDKGISREIDKVYSPTIVAVGLRISNILATLLRRSNTLLSEPNNTIGSSKITTLLEVIYLNLKNL